MADGGWLPNYVFMCMITLSDKDGFLRHDPRTLYRKIGLQEDDRVSYHEFTDAVEYLTRPDDVSNLPDHEGRRIIPVLEMGDVEGSRGWYVVNKVHYRDKGGSLEQRRAQDVERKRRQRERENNDLDEQPSKCHVTVTRGHVMSAHTDTDTDTDTDKSTTAPPVPKEPPEFEEFRKAYPLRSGAQPWTRALKAIRARLKEGSQWADFLEGAKRYADYCDSVSRTGTEYVMQAATFCGLEKHFLEPWEPPLTKSERLQDKNIGEGQDWLSAANGQ